MIGRLACTLLLAALAVACGTAPTRGPAIDPESAWIHHRAALAGISTWRLNGSLAVRSGNDGGQGHIVWRQHEARYDIRLSGPLGAGSVHLVGDEGYAELATSEGETVRSSDPEWLLYRQLGWWIPVAALRYWVLGIPAPNLPAKWALDPYGRLANLEQGGWRVEFENYIPRRDLALPGAVSVRNDKAEVRLVVRDWRSDDPSRQQVSRFPSPP